MSAPVRMRLYTLPQLLLASLVGPVAGTALVGFNLFRAQRWAPLLALGVGPVPLVIVAHLTRDSVPFALLWAGIVWPDFVWVSLSGHGALLPMAGAAAFWLATPGLVALAVERDLATVRTGPSPPFALPVLGTLVLGALAYGALFLIMGFLMATID